MLFGDPEILPSLRGAVRSQRRAPPQGGSRRTRTSPLPRTLAPLVPPEPDPPRTPAKAPSPKAHGEAPARPAAQPPPSPLPAVPAPPAQTPAGQAQHPRFPARRPQGAGAAGGSPCPDPGPPFSAGKGPQRGPHSTPRAASPKRSGCSEAHSALSDEMSFSFAEADQRPHSSPRRCGAGSGTLAPAARTQEAVGAALGRLRAAHRGHGRAPGEGP